ncbi:uncharacterized protein LOC109976747 [Xyrichtys novacula]|uniref:Uncharacterized protein LOC109976747 n=1 Tax=Xyrichtys novacula TaxID=13765 RepID=A0AAV1HNB4_XYRNO|nr:uncharacterized protein LOC109976747 [Xyrichtys novacula]
MNRWKMLLFLLLMLTLNVSGKAALINLEKTVGREPNAVPVCRNSTENIILLVICKISMRSGNDCQLFYQHKQDFENKCDSKVRLMKEIQTIFLDLTNLTPTDGGNYTCECSHQDGMKVLHLNITVRETSPEANTNLSFFPWSFIFILIAVSVFVLLTGAVVVYILCKKCCRDDTGSEEPRTSASGSSNSSNQDFSEDHYESLQEPADDVYQTISLEPLQHDAKKDNNKKTAPAHLDDPDMDDEETEEGQDIYENI